MGVRGLSTHELRAQHSSPCWQQVSALQQLNCWTAVHQVARKNSLSWGLGPGLLFSGKAIERVAIQPLSSRALATIPQYVNAFRDRVSACGQ